MAWLSTPIIMNNLNHFIYGSFWQVELIVILLAKLTVTVSTKQWVFAFAVSAKWLVKLAHGMFLKEQQN